jgi:hypothetical protein
MVQRSGRCSLKRANEILPGPLMVGLRDYGLSRVLLSSIELYPLDSSLNCNTTLFEIFR